jgi:DNA-binding CsgD family transcriptional regulator
MERVSRQTATAEISAREAEILTLVGEHRSNAEIGAQLFISVRTVETHVSSLLRKLGVPDRRALADIAAELARAERTSQALAGLPSPLNPFIGRAQERAPNCATPSGRTARSPPSAPAAWARPDWRWPSPRTWPATSRTACGSSTSCRSPIRRWSDPQ